MLWAADENGTCPASPRDPAWGFPEVSGVLVSGQGSWPLVLPGLHTESMSMVGIRAHQASHQPRGRAPTGTQNTPYATWNARGLYLHLLFFNYKIYYYKSWKILSHIKTDIIIPVSRSNNRCWNPGTVLWSYVQICVHIFTCKSGTARISQPLALHGRERLDHDACSPERQHLPQCFCKFQGVLCPQDHLCLWASMSTALLAVLACISGT